MSGEAPEAASYCADLVRSHDFVRYASTLLVPAEQRRALLALYGFNVEICRVCDQVSQPLPGEIRLQWWTDMLGGDARGGVEGNPVAAELLRAIRAFSLPIEPLLGLIGEHRFDLYDDPMPTMAALESDIAGTSTVLFTLGALTAGVRSEAIDQLALHAGMAQGLVEIICRLPQDASRRRLFLPQEVVERHGAAVEQIFSGRSSPQLSAAVTEILGEAARHLAMARSLLASVPRQARPAFLPLAMVRHDLKRLSRPGYDLFVPQFSSRLRVLWTTWRASRSPEFAK